MLVNCHITFYLIECYQVLVYPCYMFWKYSADQCVMSFLRSVSNVGCQYSCFMSTPTVDLR